MMTPKERAAMQQALDALVKCNHFHDYEDEITALREALEQPDEIDWIETNKALAKEIIELKKQAEQEPVAEVVDESVYGNATMSWVINLPLPICTKLYAAPVRTKDLTDDEIWDALTSIGFGTSCYEDARAVITADREKNNVK